MTRKQAPAQVTAAAQRWRQRWLVQMLLLARRDADQRPAWRASWPSLIRLACQFGAAGPPVPGDEWNRGDPAAAAEFETIAGMTVAELFGTEERVVAREGL